MAYNGSGTFVINTAGQPVVPNTVISATAFNALTADLANGLSTCITKDGQTTPTANIPMGNNKITGLAPGTSGTDAANLSQVQGSTAKLLQSVTGTDTITAAMVPALTSYSAGQMFYFVAAGDNTGAVTINIDSLGAKSVTRDGSTALVAGDIVSGEIALIVYDGTRFQLLNGNSFTNLNVSGTLAVGSTSTFTGAATFTANPVLNGGTANGVLYLNGSKVATSGSALTFDGTNLGIGTASPRGNLDVSSGNSAGSQTRSIHLGYSAADFYGFRVANINDAGATYAGTFRIQRGVGSSWSDDVVVNDSGNVGIGTASPGYKLDVQSATATFRLQSTTGTNAAYLWTTNTGGDFYFGRDNSTGSTFGTNSAYSAILYSANAYPMVFFTNAIERGRFTSAGNLLLGTTTVAYSGTLLNIGTTSDSQNGVQIQTSTTGIGYLLFGDGSGVDAFRGEINYAHTSDSMAFKTGGTERARIDSSGNVVVNTAAVATTATDGFLYIPGCAGTPTGTPTAYTGRVPLVVDTTNNKLYFYSGGAWRDAGP